MNYFKGLALLGQILLLTTILSPYAATTYSTVFMQGFAGHYNPYDNTVNVNYPVLDEKEEKAVSVHEYTHYQQFNILPVDSSPLIVNYGVMFLTALGLVVSTVKAWELKPRKYLLWGLIGVSPIAFLEVQAYLKAYLAYGIGFSLQGVVMYTSLIVGVFAVAYMVSVAREVAEEQEVDLPGVDLSH